MGAVEVDATAVKAALASSKESAALSKELADKAKTIQSQIEEYENRLAGFEKQCAGQLKTIESLLPGATSAGLAHSFDERRKTFLKPHALWQFVFVGSVLSMVVVALTGFLYLYKLHTVVTRCLPRVRCI